MHTSTRSCHGVSYRCAANKQCLPRAMGATLRKLRCHRATADAFNPVGSTVLHGAAGKLSIMAIWLPSHATTSWPQRLATCMHSIIRAKFHETIGILDLMLSPVEYQGLSIDTSMPMRTSLECEYDKDRKIVAIVLYTTKPYSAGLAVGRNGWSSLPTVPCKRGEPKEVVRTSVAEDHYDNATNRLVIQLYGAPVATEAHTQVAGPEDDRVLVGVDDEDKLCSISVTDPANNISHWPVSGQTSATAVGSTSTATAVGSTSAATVVS